MSIQRKESGTFYTPRAMAEYLVRATLSPLVSRASSDEILRLKVVDPAMGSGAFLVAACRFLADAYAHALEREGALPDDEPADRQRARLRRLIAQRCLFGVDVNPVAVHLARLSLWLATLAADAPLTFLDHHLRAGDSLVGAGPDELARPWPSRVSRHHDGARELPLFTNDDVAALMRGLMPVRSKLHVPDDSADVVRDKERRLRESLTTGVLPRWLTLGDAWCAWWYWDDKDHPTALPPHAWSEISAHVTRGRSALGRDVVERWIARARHIARDRRFFHWKLQFPEVFFDADGQPLPNGGFDAVIGNPPWDMVRGDAAQGGVRDRLRADAGALCRFVRTARVYEGARDAHVNRYQLFVERSLWLLRRGGRLGLVLPWGIAADRGCAPLRRRLLEQCDTESLVAFENAEGLFPIHRSVRFALLTATTGRPTRAVALRLGERSLGGLDRPSSVERGAPDASISVTPALLRRVSGETLEIPYARSPRDLRLLERLHERWPGLGSPDGWNAAFGRELNATDDRDIFAASGDGWPVVEGRHLSAFAVRLEARSKVVRVDRLEALVRRMPRVVRARLAYREVASSTNRRTLIAAVLPARVVSTHTVSALRTTLDDEAQQCLCALLNSLVADYLVRLRVTTHVSVAIGERLPVPKPARGSPVFNELGALAVRLSANDGTDRDAHTRLQALAARAYGLETAELEHVLSTFPLVPVEDRAAVLEEFCRI